MAAVNIKLTQNAVDQFRIVDQQGIAAPVSSSGTMSTVIDGLVASAYLVQTVFANFASFTLNGSSLKLIAADGAVQSYNGVVLANPTATSGAATATSVTFTHPNTFTLSQSGSLRYDYSFGDTLSIRPSATPATITELSLSTHVPYTSSDYDAELGNISIKAKGLITSTGELFNGALSSITFGADKGIRSGAIEGSFKAVGNVVSIGNGLDYSSVTGFLSGYAEEYYDGSYTRLSGLSTYIDNGQILDQLSLATQGWRFTGNDDINIDLPVQMYKTFTIGAGSGDDRVSLKGGGRYLDVDAGSGNDVVTLLGGVHRVDGGAGRDAVALSGVRADFGVTKGAGGITVTDKAGSASTLVNVERLVFSDSTLAFDTDGSAGQAYRLYQAAFNRAPDSAGLGFQIAAMDTAGVSLGRVAQGFIDSPEFARTYGALNNTDFVTQLYANVLHRAPDAAGLKFHVDLLNAGTVTRAQDLVGFSESPENQAALIGIIGNGFAYTAYAG